MSLSMLNADVPADSLGILVAGPGGVCLQDAGRQASCISIPYLSDAAERLHGFKRLSLPPMTAEQVRADLVVLTHEHADHLDPDALPIIARNNPPCRFAAPPGCTPGLTEAGVAAAARCDAGAAIDATIPRAL